MNSSFGILDSVPGRKLGRVLNLLLGRLVSNAPLEVHIGILDSVPGRKLGRVLNRLLERLVSNAPLEVHVVC